MWLQTAGRLPDTGSQGHAVNPVTMAVIQSDEPSHSTSEEQVYFVDELGLFDVENSMFFNELKQECDKRYIHVWSRGPKGDLFREVYQTH